MTDTWIEIPEVAILDAHDLLDNDGNIVMRIDDDTLDRIAENNNKRVEETGDETPISLGHTKDGVPETLQPQIIGYARNFRVKQLFKTGRKAIFCTFRVLRKYADKLKEFPRRSVELWLKKLVIDPIAVLGATTPDRDLGLLRFRAGDQSYTYVFDEVRRMQLGMNDPDNLAVKVVAMLQETKEWKFLQSLADQGMQAPAQEAPPPAGPEEEMIDASEESMPGEEPVRLDEEDEEYPVEDEEITDEEKPVEEEEEDDEDEEAAKKKYAAAPASGNTYVPSGVGRRQKYSASLTEVEKVKMQRDQLRSQLVRTEKRTAAVEKEVNELRLKLSRAEREKALVQLQSEGFDLDRAEELNEIAEFSDEQFTKHLDRIRKRYQRAPVAIDSTLVVSTRSSNVVGRSKERSAQIRDHALTKGISYEEALEQLEGQKK